MFGQINTRRTHEQKDTAFTQGYAQPAMPEGRLKASQALVPELVYNVETAAPKTSKTDQAIQDLITNALYDTLNLSQLAGMPREKAQVDIAEIISDIVTIRGIRISLKEQKAIAEDICYDLLGFGPLEPLLARDDIGDIMVNGAGHIFIETNGLIEKTDVQFRDEAQLISVCQRLASQTGRHVDQANPICDARLEDGSRINVILPPLSVKGPALTIRKFKKDRLILRDLVDKGTITPAGGRLLAIIAACQCNILVSGGTGSGKTTLLNCLTAFINPRERIITCEDTAELQLQQPHVVSLETRPPNIEGKGMVNMKDLLRNCLRMRPERIIIGEVRGPEAMELLQAMNTGHDGSMGTLHANTPRDAIARLEAMVTMSATSLPPRIIRQMIVSAVDIVVQTVRMRDGSRKITNITEVLRMDSDVVITQDLMTFEFEGEDENGRIIGTHKSSGIAKPRFWERARYFGLTDRLSEALVELGAPDFRPLTEEDEPAKS